MRGAVFSFSPKEEGADRARCSFLPLPKGERGQTVRGMVSPSPQKGEGLAVPVLLKQGVHVVLFVIERRMQLFNFK